MTKPAPMAEEDRLQRLTDLLASARTMGAESADAVLVGSTSLSHAQRLGRPETLEREESLDLGLRVFVGRRQAVVSSSDLSAAALGELAERAVSMARSVPEDPFCGLAETALLAGDAPDLDICEDAEPSPETLIDWAARAEDAARAVPGVTNSEGGEAAWGRADIALAATHGFARAYSVTHVSISASVLAGEGTGMERDYDYTAGVHSGELRSPEDVGRTAGENAVARLNPRKVSTAQVPVIYDPRAARSLLGHLAGAVNGQSVARGTSFLKDKMDQRIFAPGIDIVDDPLRRRGLRSKPFDGEGVATARRALVEDGVLKGWILDLRSARQLGLTTTGNAARGTSSPPSPAPTNLSLAPGTATPEALMADIGQGLYITELFGFGVNGVTGDYSRGAAGFWIENGVRTDAVSEVTVAGHLNDMFANLVPADDLVFRYGTDSPTVRIDGMTVAGQ